jgi:hypothetical protein
VSRLTSSRRRGRNRRQSGGPEPQSRCRPICRKRQLLTRRGRTQRQGSLWSARLGWDTYGDEALHGNGAGLVTSLCPRSCERSRWLSRWKRGSRGFAHPRRPRRRRSRLGISEKRPGMSLRCRLGRHDWRIISVDLSGHQSNRCRRCDRCFGNGRLLIQRQNRGYYGGDIGAAWVTENDERGSLVNGRFVSVSS